VATACSLAVAAGTLNVEACTNALNDSNIKNECGGGAPAPTASTAPAPTMTAPPAPGSGPCADLAQKCRKCPPGVVATACNFALSAGQLDVHACTNALSDKDISAQCH
jgi:hypothetical protein